MSDVPIIRLFIPPEEDEQALVNLGELIGVETKRPTETRDGLPSNGFVLFATELNVQLIECFHMTLRRPCWCPKPILWELNSFLMLMNFSINLHTVQYSTVKILQDGKPVTMDLHWQKHDI